jgi:hypothetical protein
MKHIRQFESFRKKMRRDEIIKESVLQVDDLYKVRTTVDIPQSLINAYVKKVKEKSGKNLRQYFGDVDIAEEIVKYLTVTGLDAEKISAGALVGGGQGQSQFAQKSKSQQSQGQQAQTQQGQQEDEDEQGQGQQGQGQQGQGQQEEDEDFEDVEEDEEDEQDLPEEEEEEEEE